MKTILVIEDEPQMRHNIVSLLKLEGFRVLEAADGQVAVEAARRHSPDLILCDITMPKMDGYAVLNVMRSDPALRTVPFVFLTAHGQISDIRTGMNLGADDYLPKPFSVADLLATIEARLLRVESLQQEAQPDFDSSEPLEGLGLTPREAEVLLWMAQGKSNADIATILDNTVGTVKKHAQHIFEKLGVDNRTSALLVAREKLAACRPRRSVV